MQALHASHGSDCVLRHHARGVLESAERVAADLTSKVFSNIGTGRIGTLLFFGIIRIVGKSVICGESRKFCPGRKV